MYIEVCWVSYVIFFFFIEINDGNGIRMELVIGLVIVMYEK